MPNWVDLVFIIMVSLFVWGGYAKGFIRQVGDLLILVISVVISFSLYGALGNFLSSHFHTALLSGFLGKMVALAVLWFGTQIIFELLWRILYHQLPEGLKESFLNKVTGTIPGLLWGLVFSVIVLVLATLVLGFFPNYQNYHDALAESVAGKIVFSQSDWFQNQALGLLGTELGGEVSFRTVEPNANTVYFLGYKTTDVKTNTDLEGQMLVLVNKERENQKLAPLTMDRALTAVAEEHGRDMFAKGYFAHNDLSGKTPFKRLDEAGIKYVVAGENLALAPNLDSAHQGLMASPGHRANILAPEFGKVGIGVIDGGKYGIIFVQEFTN